MIWNALGYATYTKLKSRKERCKDKTVRSMATLRIRLFQKPETKEGSWWKSQNTKIYKTYKHIEKTHRPSMLGTSDNIVPFQHTSLKEATVFVQKTSNLVQHNTLNTFFGIDFTNIARNGQTKKRIKIYESKRLFAFLTTIFLINPLTWHQCLLSNTYHSWIRRKN